MVLLLAAFVCLACWCVVPALRLARLARLGGAGRRLGEAAPPIDAPVSAVPAGRALAWRLALAQTPIPPFQRNGLLLGERDGSLRQSPPFQRDGPQLGDCDCDGPTYCQSEYQSRWHVLKSLHATRCLGLRDWLE